MLVLRRRRLRRSSAGPLRRRFNEKKNGVEPGLEQPPRVLFEALLGHPTLTLPPGWVRKGEKGRDQGTRGAEEAGRE